MPLLGAGIIPSGPIGLELQATVRRVFAQMVVVLIYKQNPLLALLLEERHSRQRRRLALHPAGADGAVRPIKLDRTGRAVQSAAGRGRDRQRRVQHVLLGDARQLAWASNNS